MKESKREGISLIVLIITIIVIVILAVAIILSISNNNPISNAKEAVTRNDFATMKEELSLYIADQYVEKNGNFDPNTLNATTKEEVTAILSSIKGTDYADVVIIKNGTIMLTGNASEVLTEEQIEIANQVGLSKILTAKDLIGKESEYIGKYTNYKVANDASIKWRIFDIVGEGDNAYVTLISENCVNLEKAAIQATGNIVISGYTLTDPTVSDSQEMINYLTNPDNWVGFKDSDSKFAESVVGTPTLQEFQRSYNKKFTPTLDISLQGYGYYVKLSNTTNYEYRTNVGTTGIDIDLYILLDDLGTIEDSYWLASPSGDFSYCAMSVIKSGYVTCECTTGTPLGVRPVISLKSTVKMIEKNEMIELI